jgi:ATP phosphoribosyltransferase
MSGGGGPGSGNSKIHLALPKGRMQEGVTRLLADAGITLSAGSRGYRPTISLAGYETKVLKPQNIVEMLDVGTRDIGFAGADWVAELDSGPVELLDTGLDRVTLVVAVPRALAEGGVLPRRSLVIASEYVRLAGRWIERRGCADRLVRSYGATEVFPPEDADGIIDIAATGATLEANGLVAAETILVSSTRLYASRRAMDDPVKRRAAEDLAVVLRSVLEARQRVMLELNVTPERLDAVIEVLPCMRRPTLSPLSGQSGFAVKAAVPRQRLPELIPLLKSRGGTDIVISPLSQVVP